jgi:amphi-Trp domain-containing protein
MARPHAGFVAKMSPDHRALGAGWLHKEGAGLALDETPVLPGPGMDNGAVAAPGTDAGPGGRAAITLDACADEGETSRGARRTNVSDDKNKIGLEGEMELSRVIALLEDIVSGLKSGVTHFSFGERTLRLTPSPVVQVEIKASQKKKEEKIGLKLTWSPVAPLNVTAKS